MSPYLIKLITKMAGGVAQCEGPEFKPQYHKKKNCVCTLRNTVEQLDYSIYIALGVMVI
jgi:hypothetical protein